MVVFASSAFCLASLIFLTMFPRRKAGITVDPNNNPYPSSQFAIQYGAELITKKNPKPLITMPYFMYRSPYLVVYPIVCHVRVRTMGAVTRSPTFIV